MMWNMIMFSAATCWSCYDSLALCNMRVKMTALAEQSRRTLTHMLKKVVFAHLAKKRCLPHQPFGRLLRYRYTLMKDPMKYLKWILFKLFGRKTRLGLYRDEEYEQWLGI